MKVALSILWLALSGLFFFLAWDHWESGAASLPPFETAEPSFEFSGSGFHIELDVHGTPLDQPFQELEADLSAYLADLEARLAASHRRDALGLAAAGLAALLGLLLTWMTPARRDAPPG